MSGPLCCCGIMGVVRRWFKSPSLAHHQLIFHFQTVSQIMISVFCVKMFKLPTSCIVYYNKCQLWDVIVWSFPNREIWTCLHEYLPAGRLPPSWEMHYKKIFSKQIIGAFDIIIRISLYYQRTAKLLLLFHAISQTYNCNHNCINNYVLFLYPK